MEYYEFYLMGIILIPGIIFAIIAESRVYSTYSKYSHVISQRGDIAEAVARRLLNTYGAGNVSIIHVRGDLSDYYDNSKQIVALSSSNSNSLSAIAVAAHEVGHAIQYKEDYTPIKIRNVVIKTSNLTSDFLWPLVIIGLLFNFIGSNTLVGRICVWSGIAFFLIAVIMNLITLPVEFNASNRGLRMLLDTGEITEEESVACKQVLKAAAMTYVAALVISILNLLRFLIVVSSATSDD